MRTQLLMVDLRRHYSSQPVVLNNMTSEPIYKNPYRYSTHTDLDLFWIEEERSETSVACDVDKYVDTTWTDEPWRPETMLKRYNFDPKKLSFFQRLPRYALETWIWAEAAVDMYAVYKNVPSHTAAIKRRYRTYRRGHLLAEPTHKEGPLWFRIATRFSRMLMWFTFSRMLYGLTLYIFSNKSRVDFKDRLVCTHLQLLFALYEPWGMIFYTIMTVAQFYLILCPLVFSKIPADSPIYRFMVEPWRELERLHMEVDSHINSVLVNAQLRADYDIGGQHTEVRKSIRSLRIICNELLHERWICHPRTFTSEGFVEIHDLGIVVSTIFSSIAFVVYFAIYIQIVLLVGVHWQTVQLLWEVSWAMWNAVSTIVMFLAVVCLVTRFQARNISDLGQDIIDCIRQVRLENESATAQQQDCNSCVKANDKLLLSVLIKSRLCFEDTKRFAFVLRVLTMCCTVIVFEVLAIAIFHHKSVRDRERSGVIIDVHSNYVLAVMFVWLCFNIYMLWCAEFVSKIQQTSRVAATLVCEIQARAHRLRRTRISCDFIEARWRKLVLSDALVGKHLAVRVFGIAITFHQILELNYAVATIVAYLRLY